jgi:hypothetical protein
MRDLWLGAGLLPLTACGDDFLRVYTEYGMMRGRYYKSLTGGAPPNFCTSSAIRVIT